LWYSAATATLSRLSTAVRYTKTGVSIGRSELQKANSPAALARIVERTLRMGRR